VLARAERALRACGWALALLVASYLSLASHLDGQVKVVANPPLQLLHILTHPLHGLV